MTGNSFLCPGKFLRQILDYPVGESYIQLSYIQDFSVCPPTLDSPLLPTPQDPSKRSALHCPAQEGATESPPAVPWLRVRHHRYPPADRQDFLAHMEAHLRLSHPRWMRSLPRTFPHPLNKANTVSKLCEKIAGLQSIAKHQAKQITDQLEDPAKLISTLRDQVETVTSLQKCVADLANTREGLTRPLLDELKRTSKELVDITDQTHKDSTLRGIRLTPKVHKIKGAQSRP